MKHFLFYITALFFSSFLHAQDADKIPRLKNDLSKAANDSDRADALAELCFNYSGANTDTALMFGKEALKLSTKINYIKGIGDSYNNIGWIYYSLANYNDAEEYFKKALSFFKRTGKPEFISIPIANLGTLYMDKTEYAKSLDCFMQVIKYEDEIKDSSFGNILNNKAATLHDIGRLYNLQKNFAAARKYFQQALDIGRSIKSDARIGENLMSIGNTYQIENKHETALKYYYECLKYIERTTDIYRLGIAHENIAVSYFALNRNNEAVKHFTFAKENYARLKSKADMFSISLNLAEVYSTLKNSAQAIAMLNEASQYAYELDNKNLQQEVLTALSRFYREHGDYKKSYEYLDNSYKIKDSIFTLEKQNELIKLQTQFETEEKEKQIALLKKDQQLNKLSIQKQKTFQYAGAIIMLLLIVMGAVIINRYRVIQRIKRKVEIEQVRNNIARSLHDDIGSTLTSINILSKVALQQAETNTSPNQNIQKIKDRSLAIMESMSDIVWSVNPMNDSLDKIIIRMKEFASELCEQSGIAFSFKEEGDLSNLKLSLKHRSDLYLIFKEAINNAVKYSEATTLEAFLEKKPHSLYLHIKDDGKGFNVSSHLAGNGLKNMSKRAEEIDAVYKINSLAGSGTEVTLDIPVT